MNKAFTLVEILVAVMLTGLLTTLAIAPAMTAIRSVTDTMNSYSDRAALSRTLDFIARDLSSAMRLSPNVVRIVEHEALGGFDDDVLLFMSTSPSVQGLPGGTVAYKVSEGGLLHRSYIQGLYRWMLPGRQPNAVNTEKLNVEDGQLVLAGVKDFAAEISDGKEDNRRKEYSGPLPPGIWLKISRGERKGMTLHTEDDEGGDELAQTVVFP